VQKAHNKKIEKACIANDEICIQLENNKACKEQIVNQLTITTGSSSSGDSASSFLLSAELKHFKVINFPLLKSFYWAHSWKGKKPCLHKWPNKGTMQDAENGTNNMIKRAYDICSKLVIHQVVDAAMEQMPSPLEVTNLARIMIWA
jgi:hypothetical protein